MFLTSSVAAGGPGLNSALREDEGVPHLAFEMWNSAVADAIRGIQQWQMQFQVWIPHHGDLLDPLKVVLH